MPRILATLSSISRVLASLLFEGMELVLVLDMAIS
jgi:hypothetical protein